MTEPRDIDDNHEEAPRTGWNSRGASISVHRDPRMSKLLAWVWVMLGGAIVSGTWIAANNLYQLNLTVSRMADNNAVVARQISDHELRLRQMERDVSTLEGKVYRGVSGYEEPVKPRGGVHGR